MSHAVSGAEGPRTPLNTVDTNSDIVRLLKTHFLTPILDSPQNRIELVARPEAYQVMCCRIERVALNLNEFRELHPATQHALLRHNTDLIVSLRGAVFFDQAKKGLDQVNYPQFLERSKLSNKLLTLSAKVWANGHAAVRTALPR